MFTAIISLTILGLLLGFALAIAAHHLKVEGNPLAKEIELMLPGSQCGQCGFPGCETAANALALGSAPATLCPPGGSLLAQQLASKLSIDINLTELSNTKAMIATINASLCIGCTKCFKRCPTDAIVGGPKQIHAVISDLCTGCEKCVDVCPTECVSVTPPAVCLQNWYWPKPSIAA